MHTQTSLEDKIDNYLFGGSSTQNDDSLSQEGFHLAYTDLAITLEQNNRLLDRVELCLYSMEQSQSISQFLSDNSLSLEKVPNWMSNAGKNVGEWFKKAWEYLKQGFLKMIKAIGGFFKRFVSIFEKKKANISRNAKGIEWDQNKADTMTVMTKINPEMKDKGSNVTRGGKLSSYSPIVFLDRSINGILNSIDSYIREISSSMGRFSAITLSEISEKTLYRTETDKDNNLIGRMEAFLHEIVSKKESDDNFFILPSQLKTVYKLLYGQEDEPILVNQKISDIASEDDVLRSIIAIASNEKIVDQMKKVVEDIVKNFDLVYNKIRDLRSAEGHSSSDTLDRIASLSIQITQELNTQFKNLLSVSAALSTARLDMISVIEEIMKKIST